MAGAKEEESANCTCIRMLNCDRTKGRQVRRLEEQLDKDAVCH